MIGRHDVSFRSETPGQTVEGVVRIVRAAWSEAIVENAETGEILPGDRVGVARLPVELLIYQGEVARDSWAKHGAIAENSNSMIHVLCGEASITVVVDDPLAHDMAPLLNAMREHVYQDIFWIRAHAA
jgi:hypothetical protein